MAGLDGGGTKTAVCVIGTDGSVIHSFKSGAININGVGRDTVKNNIKEIILGLKNKFGLESCRGICAAAAGITNGDAARIIESAVREAGYDGELLIAGDCMAALYGALEKPKGIILIAGTGSVCLDVSADGREYRTGGYGHLIDDAGSGYAIGRDILSSVVRAHDGRGAGTILTGLVYDFLRINSVEELIHFVYTKGLDKSSIASLAVLLTEAVKHGDKAACGIADRCAGELVSLVEPVAEKLNVPQNKLAMCGSILQKDPFIQSGFRRLMRERLPGINCVQPRRGADYGAALMIREKLAAYGQAE